MTDMDPDEIRRRRAVQQMAKLWPSGWTKDRADAIHAAISDLTPDDVEAACTDLIRTWTALVIPPPAEIRIRADQAAAARARADQDRVERAHHARSSASDQPPSIRAVHGKLCAVCRGDLVLLTHDRTLWCPTCRTVQAVRGDDGRPRVRLTAQEVADLRLQNLPDDHAVQRPSSDVADLDAHRAQRGAA